MANLERLRQQAGPWGNVFGQRPENAYFPERGQNDATARREVELQEIRRRQQAFYEARAMAPTTSYTESSGWVPPYTWDPANPMYVPAIFAHPTYLGSRVPPAMTTQAPIAPEAFAAMRGQEPPRSLVSQTVAQTLQTMDETSRFRTGDRDEQPRAR